MTNLKHADDTIVGFRVAGAKIPSFCSGFTLAGTREIIEGYPNEALTPIKLGEINTYATDGLVLRLGCELKDYSNRWGWEFVMLDDQFLYPCKIGDNGPLFRVCRTTKACLGKTAEEIVDLLRNGES